MDHKILAAKISHIADSVRGALKNPKAQYFDSGIVGEWFARFDSIRKELKSDYGDLFSDLQVRPPPPVS